MQTRNLNRRSTRSLLAQVLVIAAVALSGVVALGTDAQAQQVPQVLPYQGYLARSNGTPVEGTVNLTFSLYDTSQSQQALWTETLTNVPVADGVFYVYLGQQSDVMNYFGDGTTRYLGIAVNNDPEATPRQSLGSVPYALLAGNALQLGGYGPDYFATQNDIANFLTQNDLNNYVTEQELSQTLNNYITEEEYVNGNGNIDLDNYVTEQELADALANYVTADQLASYNYVTQQQLANYVTQDQLANYVTQNDLANYVTTDQLNNYVTQQQFSQLQTQVTNLQTQVTNLQTQVTNLGNNNNNGNAVPFILGRSTHVDNGTWNFGGKKGLAAANQACKTAYNDDTAHVCMPHEVAMAIADESWDTNNQGQINNVRSWIPSYQEYTNVTTNNMHLSTAGGSCHNFNYESGHIARGSTLTITFNTNIDRGNNNTNTFSIDKDIACSTTLPVMCCR